MDIHGEKVLLRDMRAEDTADYVHWNTVEKEWQQEWDAPWEYTEESLETVTAWAAKMVTKNLAPPEIRSRFEICLLDGEHIGWVSSYFMDDDKDKLAIGIDIPPVIHRGKGYGREAWELFIRYLRGKGINDIYTQTWSGNTKMIKMAESTGFKEIRRLKGHRFFRGRVYDALTFINKP
jgi:RimJ/RimL family protein N-acetyltransferase